MLAIIRISISGNRKSLTNWTVDARKPIYSLSIGAWNPVPVYIHGHFDRTVAELVPNVGR
jgi:hypothetical protein